MKTLLLLIFLPLAACAEDFSGIGSTPLAPRNMGGGLTFSVVTKPPGNTLHWKIVRDKNVHDLGPDSTTSGESTNPDEKFAYLWDSKTSTFWFATPRSIVKAELADWDRPKTLYRSTPSFNNYSDLPLQFKKEISEILK